MDCAPSSKWWLKVFCLLRLPKNCAVLSLPCSSQCSKYALQWWNNAQLSLSNQAALFLWNNLNPHQFSGYTLWDNLLFPAKGLYFSFLSRLPSTTTLSEWGSPGAPILACNGHAIYCLFHDPGILPFFSCFSILSLFVIFLFSFTESKWQAFLIYNHSLSSLFFFNTSEILFRQFNNIMK
jgi:hypothetical protein